MDSLQQQPRPTESAKEEALKQYIQNLQQAKEILNLLTIRPQEVPDDILAATIATLKTLLLDAGPYIKPQDEEVYKWLLTVVLQNPMTQLRTPSTIDQFQEQLNYTLKNSGLYELGKPSQIKRIMQHINIDEVEDGV